MKDTNLWGKASAAPLKPVEGSGDAPEQTPALAPVQAANDAQEAPALAPVPSSRRRPSDRKFKALPTLKVEDLVGDLKLQDEQVVRTYRVRADHDEWLRKAAFELRGKRGNGKADASEVLRLLLDRAMGIKRDEA